MITNWAGLGKARFSEMRQNPTDKTDKTPVSSVLSVPIARVFEKPQGVSSVLSVLAVPILKKRTVNDLDAPSIPKGLVATAMKACDRWHDESDARQELVNDLQALPAHLWAEALAHFQQNYGD